MSKPKNWTPGEVVEAAEYLSNISGRFAEHLLRIYDDKGDLVHTCCSSDQEQQGGSRSSRRKCT